MRFIKRLVFIVYMIISTSVQAKLVEYNFDINKKTVNYTKSNVAAIAIDDSIPAPTISATVGDTLEVTFNNKLNIETSVHWHGILLPNDQDGVPHLTTPPIAANSSFTYKFEVTHSGTYWYHSHTGLQEQQGVYGSIIFYPKQEKNKADIEHVVVLSDWTNENPIQVIKNLKLDGDYYALKKNSVQSWDKVLQYGKKSIQNRLHGALTRMGPMDLSDIGYDAFLANGKQTTYLAGNLGDTVKLRVINAAASSYFNIEFSGGDMTIIAADGVNVDPLRVKRLRIAIAETYDILIKIPDNKSYEFKATSEDGTGYSSTFIGKGDKVLALTIPRPNLFFVDHSKHGNHKQHMHHNGMHTEVIPYMTDYSALRAVTTTSLPSDSKQQTIVLNLTGNMERYVWSFNNKTLLESDKILIKKGNNIRFILNNETMMHHPVHLHGHFFRVINGQGDRSPLKHTVNVPAMDKVEIEFAATEEKDWFFHCHNLYHMKSGMARVVSYEDSTVATADTFNKISSDPWYLSRDISLLSNMTAGVMRASNSRSAIEFEYDYNYKKEYDLDLKYLLSFTRFFNIYAGGNIEKEHDEKSEATGIIGIEYVLPMLINSDLRIDTKNKLRLGIGSDLQLTKRNKLEWDWNTNKECRLVWSYEVSKKILLSAIYDSDFKLGAGIRAKF